LLGWEKKFVPAAALGHRRLLRLERRPLPLMLPLHLHPRVQQRQLLLFQMCGLLPLNMLLGLRAESWLLDHSATWSVKGTTSSNSNKGRLLW
jgi:hypothetical protein